MPSSIEDFFRLSISRLKKELNKSMLNAVGQGGKDIFITSHGFPVAKITALTAEDRGLGAQVTAIDPAPPVAIPVPYVPPVHGTWPTTGVERALADNSNTFTTSEDATFTYVDNSTLNLPSKSVSMEEAVARQETPPGYLTEDDLKAAQEVEHEDTVSSEQAKKELDPPEVKKIPFVTTTPGQGKRTGFEYSVPLSECSLEMLETLLTNTKQVETIERAKIMTAIVKHRPFTATETEIYRQLMAPFIPPPSDDGT